MNTTVTLYELDGTGTGTGTGDFLGHGTLLMENMIAVHPLAARRLLAITSPTQPIRVRCEITTDSGNVQVADGQVVLPAGAVTDLVGVKLDTVTDARPDTIPWEADGPGEEAAVLRRHLESAAAREAEKPSLRPPERPSGGVPAGHDTPSRGAPWCSWWSTGWGCHH